MTRAPLAATVLLLVVGTSRAGGEHEMLAAEQELRIGRDHLQAADPAYEGHRRAAIDHPDRALREIRAAIRVSRGRVPELGPETALPRLTGWTNSRGCDNHRAAMSRDGQSRPSEP